MLNKGHVTPFVDRLLHEYLNFRSVETKWEFMTRVLLTCWYIWKGRWEAVFQRRVLDPYAVYCGRLYEFFQVKHESDKKRKLPALARGMVPRYWQKPKVVMSKSFVIVHLTKLGIYSIIKKLGI